MPTYSLESCPLFASLEPEEIEKLANYAVPLTYRADEVLFDVGDPSDTFYLVIQGSVKITVPKTDAEDEKTLTLADGGFFGEIGLIRDCPRTASAYVKSGTKLVSLPGGKFEELVERDGNIARKIILAILDRTNEFVPAVEEPRRSAKSPQVLMVVNGGEREGASFIAANLAARIGEAAPGSVLVLDSHFEDMGLERYLGTLSNLGSYAHIQNQERVDAAILRDAVRSLDCGVDILGNSDGILPDALRPRHVNEILRAAREIYDVVIVDAGPGEDLLRSEIAKLADAAIVVIEATESSIEGADRRSKWLEDHGLAGRLRYVVNKVDEETDFDPEAVRSVLGDKLLGTVQRSSATGAGEAGDVHAVRANPTSTLALEISSILCQIRAGEMTDPPGLSKKARQGLFWGFKG